MRYLGVPAVVAGSLTLEVGFGLSVILAARIPRIIILIITTVVIQAAHIMAEVTAADIMAAGVIVVVAEDIIDLVMSRRPNTSLEPTGVGAVSSAARFTPQFAGGSVLGR